MRTAQRLDYPEVRSQFGLGRKRLQQLMRDGHIRGYRDPIDRRKRLFDPAEIENYLTTHND